MSVFIALTEGHGEYVGELTLVHAETNQPLFKGTGPLVFANPLEVLEIDMQIPPIQFQQAGLYHLDLSVDGELLKSRKFVVRAPQEGAQ